jgi:phage terminase large subunit
MAGGKRVLSKVLGTDLLIDWQDPDYEALCAERLERLKRLREDPKLKANLASLEAVYAEDPALFIAHWGWTFDPRNAEIKKPTVIPFLLFQKQHEFIEWLKARWFAREDGLTEKSRDMGVTWLCVGFAVWMWKYHPGSVVGFGSRKEEYVDKIGDPKSIFWKVRFFIEFLPDELKPAGYTTKQHAPFMRVVNPANGSAIVGEAGDNIGRGNRTSIYFKDESAFYEHPEAIDAALSQTSNCKIDVSTVNGAGNPFYKKRHGGRISVFVFDWRDDPRKSREWYEKQVATLDPVIVAAEIDRDYESSTGDAYIPGQSVTAAMQRGPMELQPIGGLRVGVDPARFGDDWFSITFRRGRVVLKQVKRRKLDVVQGAAFVKVEVEAYKEEPEQIAVDTIGIGAGVADILRSEGFYPDRWMGNGKIRRTVVDVNSALEMNDGANYNLRAYMAVQVKEWLAAGASLPNDSELRMAMTCFKYKFKGGLLLIESKEDVKKRLGRSPDEYDSLALTFAYPSLVEIDAPPSSPYVPAVAGVM